MSRSVVDRFYATLDARDLESWSELLDDDVEITVGSRAVHGRDAACAWAAGIVGSKPRVVAGSRRVVSASAEAVVCELQLTDAARGSACEVIRLRGGRIVSMRSFTAPAEGGAEAQLELERLLDEQAGLHRVAKLVARSESRAVVLDAVALEAWRLVGGHFTALLQYEPDGPAVIVAMHGAEAVDHVMHVGMRLATEGDGLVQRVRRSARAERVDSYAAVPGSNAATARELGLTCGVGAPIITEGRVWGAITVLSRRPLPPTVETRLGLFAELIATAIANAQARTALQALADEQSALRHVAELVARAEAPEDVFAAVAREASGLLGGQAMTLTRFTGDRALVVVATHRGPAPVGTEISFEADTLPDWIRRDGRVVRVDDYRVERDAELAARFGLAAAVAAPIVVAGEEWGMLTATSDAGPLPPGTEARLQKFAELVAATLANTQARTELQALADEQAALRRAAEVVARGPALEEVFAAVATEASKLLGGRSTALLRHDPDGFATTVATCRSPAPVGLRVPAEHDLAGQLGGGAAAVLILVDGRVWGVLSTSTPGSPPPAGTEDRLAEFADIAGAAIANAENKAKLTASRARVVATADETRRRLQRDVHDAAQQRLVHAIITLKLARDAIAAGGEATELVSEALGIAERADRELRDVVRGILPASLTRGGLRTGLESLAVDLPLPVDLDVTGRRLDAQIETTAYFVVAEALTNVVKHAGASRATVAVAVESGRLSIDVRDDGVGGADPERGTGLTGLLDRIEANAGALTITSPPGGGTTLHAMLPLRDSRRDGATSTGTG